MARFLEDNQIALKVASVAAASSSYHSKSRADKMVEWTDFERTTIQDIFSKMDYEDVGPAALSRSDIMAVMTNNCYLCTVLRTSSLNLRL